MQLEYTIAIAGLISTLAFSWAYIITRHLEHRQTRTYRSAVAFEQQCVACKSSQLVPIQLTLPDGCASLMAVNLRGDQVESVGALRCETCGHIMLYSEPILSYGGPHYHQNPPPFRMPPTPSRHR